MWSFRSFWAKLLVGAWQLDVRVNREIAVEYRLRGSDAVDVVAPAVAVSVNHYSVYMSVPMVTFLMFIRKRPELSRAEFVDYYENKHIELIGRLVGGRPKAYRRHYAVEGDPLVHRLTVARGDRVADLAAVTELTFERYADAEAMVGRMLADDVLPQVLADERRFIAPEGISWLLTQRE